VSNTDWWCKYTGEEAEAAAAALRLSALAAEEEADKLRREAEEEAERFVFIYRSTCLVIFSVLIYLCVRANGHLVHRERQRLLQDTTQHTIEIAQIVTQPLQAFGDDFKRQKVLRRHTRPPASAEDIHRFHDTSDTQVHVCARV